MIRLVSDSTTGLPIDTLEKYRIPQASQIIHFGQESFREGVDITVRAFFDKLKTADEFPKTSAPTVGEFVSIYQTILDETPDATILSIHPSTDVSGTVRSALAALDQFSGADIRVIDTRFISVPLAMIVSESARMVDDGASAEDVMAFIDHAKKTAKAYFVVDTLDYLVRGGRIGKASHLVGTLLDIKPILKMEDGVISSHRKARTRKKSLSAIRDIVREEASQAKRLHLGMGHALCEEEITDIWRELVDELKPEKTMVGEIPPSVGVHAGPGMATISWVEPL